MGGIGIIILLFAVVSVFQVFLSLRKNRNPGLLIPGLNALIATVFGMMGSDYIIGYFIFVVLLLPIILWLGIYKICRNKLKNNAENELKKFRIKNL